MTPEPIAGHLVAHALKVSLRALDDWHAIGFLTYASETRRCYRETDLDTLLAQGACNFEALPTFADLIAGRVRLLTPQEAAAELTIEPGEVFHLVKKGFLSAVKCRRDLRYCEASVKRRVAILKALTTKQIAHILGVSPGTVRQLAAQNKLVKKSGKKRNRYSYESLVVLLKELLPPHQMGPRTQRLAGMFCSCPS